MSLAARYAQEKYGIGKVLIVDWDVHHGNGTQDIFYEDESVFFMSSHQYPWYPGTGSAVETGKGKGLGSTLNFHYLREPEKRKSSMMHSGRTAKRMDSYRPGLVLISAGF